MVARRNARKPCWDHVSHHHECQQAEVEWVREWDGMGSGLRGEGEGRGLGVKVGSLGRETGRDWMRMVVGGLEDWREGGREGGRMDGLERAREGESV